VCDLFALNYPRGWRLSGESRFDFRNCISMQVMDTAQAISYQPLPLWWTGDSPFPRRAPGKRRSKAGSRERNRRAGWWNRLGRWLWTRQLKVRWGVVMQNQPKPDDRLAQKGMVSRSIGHTADRRSLKTRPGIKHRPNVARNGCAEQSNPFDALQKWSRQPAASPNGRDCPRS